MRPPPQQKLLGSPPAAGSALIVVVWVISLLAILISSFAFDAHLEARLTSYYRKRSQASYLARSGVELARLMVARSSVIDPRTETVIPDGDPWYSQARQLAGANHMMIERQYGSGEVHVEIKSELARRNVNLLIEEEHWEPVLEVADVPEEYWPALIESFLDWIDKDDETRNDGAESDDYYETLSPPYRARNGNLFTVDELLLIKNFTPAIVYGGVLDPDSDEPIIISGMADLLTTYGDAKVDVNSASDRVLMTLPDPDGRADEVVAEVRGELAGTGFADDSVDTFFQSDADLFARVPSLNVPERRQFATAKASSIYRITSRGVVGNVEHVIHCIAKRSDKTITLLQWREDG